MWVMFQNFTTKVFFLQKTSTFTNLPFLEGKSSKMKQTKKREEVKVPTKIPLQQT